MTKLACANCIFFSSKWYYSLTDSYYRYARCTHPDAVRHAEDIDPVSGVSTKLTETPYCSIMRKHECGENAKWFKPIPPKQIQKS